MSTKRSSTNQKSMKKLGNKKEKGTPKQQHRITAVTAKVDIEVVDDDFDDNDNYDTAPVGMKMKDVGIASVVTTKQDDHVERSTAVTTTTSQIVDQIAELCEAILENPQQAFSTSSTTTTTTTGTSSSSKQRRSNTSNSKKDVSKMDQLLHWARGGSNGTAGTTNTNNNRLYDMDYISQLAIMSLLVIYKDIIPSYRIRLPTQQEMSIKISKDIQQLWDYERTLLNHYQQYLMILQNCWDVYSSSSNKTATSSSSLSSSKNTLGVTCIVSMTELLKSAFHFNFRSNLITAIIRQMNYQHHRCSTTTDIDTTNNNIRTACCDAIKYVFMNDHQGDVTLEATRQISKYMKDRDYKHISISMLQTFYYIPLRVHVDEATAAKIAIQVNKKKRKRNAELAMIENEMKEGSTSVDKIVLATCQSDTLQLVILTYFRILKSIIQPSSSPLPNTSTTGTSISSNHQSQSKQHIQELLPTALEGLAKFAHLINIDTVIDLLNVLRDLLSNNNQSNDSSSHNLLPVDATLNCILTAFQTLHGPGKEMKIDMKEYIIPLYNQIPRIVECTTGTHHKNHNNTKYSVAQIDSMMVSSKQQQQQQKSITELVLQCLTLAFIQRREYSNVRIAAFMKQLLTVTLHCASSTEMSIPLLAFVRQLIQRYNTALQQLFENEQDVITEGQYRMDVSDPEHANPYATSAWECTLLQFHYNAQVRAQATDVATCKMLNLPLEDPTKLHATEQNKLLQHDLYVPFVRQKKRHPLSMNTATANDNNNSSATFANDTTKKARTNVRFITPRRSVKRSMIQIESKMN